MTRPSRVPPTTKTSSRTSVATAPWRSKPGPSPSSHPPPTPTTQTPASGSRARSTTPTFARASTRSGRSSWYRSGCSSACPIARNKPTDSSRRRWRRRWRERRGSRPNARTRWTPRWRRRFRRWRRGRRGRRRRRRGLRRRWIGRSRDSSRGGGVGGVGGAALPAAPTPTAAALPAPPPPEPRRRRGRVPADARGETRVEAGEAPTAAASSSRVRFFGGGRWDGGRDAAEVRRGEGAAAHRDDGGVTGDGEPDVRGVHPRGDRRAGAVARVWSLWGERFAETGASSRGGTLSFFPAI